jgi:hypothetical protein
VLPPEPEDMDPPLLLAPDDVPGRSGPSVPPAAHAG